MAKITGIGGVFFKSRNDPKALADWYKTHLGMPVADWGGAALEWADDHAEDKGATAWNPAKPDTQWFAPSDASFMINYRIDSMDEMIAQLKAGGIALQKGPEYHENGVFAWIVDPDGNKVELWQPMKWDAKNKK